ncbi:hypothetical protein RSAG8_13317, partial [Rhizoctonia solani AG-8 WAC10335]
MDSPNRGFSYQVHQAMKKVTEECVIHLKQEIRGALEELFLKGAAEAEAKALATHDLFAPRVTHWATYRASEFELPLVFLFTYDLIHVKLLLGCMHPNCIIGLVCI